ncbi:hypothetical protein C8R45DRAFT_256260 [Mycena sanguinolenta]|nr:hypothetical protein C8R45DRAFT_256260 [Mycena sanguinolenta]
MLLRPKTFFDDDDFDFLCVSFLSFLLYLFLLSPHPRYLLILVTSSSSLPPHPRYPTSSFVRLLLTLVILFFFFWFTSDLISYLLSYLSIVSADLYYTLGSICSVVVACV